MNSYRPLLYGTMSEVWKPRLQTEVLATPTKKNLRSSAAKSLISNLQFSSLQFSNLQIRKDEGEESSSRQSTIKTPVVTPISQAQVLSSFELLNVPGNFLIQAKSLTRMPAIFSQNHPFSIPMTISIHQSPISNSPISNPPAHPPCNLF